MFLSYFKITKSLYSNLLICDKNYKRIIHFPYSILKGKSLSCVKLDTKEYITIETVPKIKLENYTTPSLLSTLGSIPRPNPTIYRDEKSFFYSLSGPLDERHFYLTNLIAKNLHPKLRSKPFLTQSQKIPIIHTGDRLLLDCFTALVKQKSKIKMIKKKRDDLKQSQIYYGRVISKKLDKRRIQSSSVTVFREKKGYRTEKSIILNSPWLKNIGVTSRSNVPRSKLFYLRERSTKKSRFRSRFFSRKRLIKENEQGKLVYFEEENTI